jgi:metallophosphoesterase superfamily enzyme
VKAPAPRAASYPLARGAVALPGGLAWLPGARALVAADAHFAYEDVVGGALPLWSTDEIAAALTLWAARMNARELIFLGDVIHGSRMSEGAARKVIAVLEDLRSRLEITIVAGNHEGRSRGVATLGSIVEEAERDGWLLVHGDVERIDPRPVMIGHLHPSLHLAGTSTVPAFLGSERLVVVPALTPYSSGLDVLSGDCARVLDRWTNARRELHVVGVTSEAVYPLGALAALRSLAGRGRRPSGKPARFRRRLGPG